tara:strand:+ start:1261 stop:1692 length:432 start_codon:yes stop_codon:yes gene_type:complete
MSLYEDYDLAERYLSDSKSILLTYKMGSYTGNFIIQINATYAMDDTLDNENWDGNFSEKGLLAEFRGKLTAKGEFIMVDSSYPYHLHRKDFEELMENWTARKDVDDVMAPHVEMFHRHLKNYMGPPQESYTPINWLNVSRYYW